MLNLRWRNMAPLVRGAIGETGFVQPLDDAIAEHEYLESIGERRSGHGMAPAQRANSKPVTCGT